MTQEEFRQFQDAAEDKELLIIFTVVADKDAFLLRLMNPHTNKVIAFEIQQTSENEK